MARKKFTRYTKGRNQQVIVSKPTAISTQATEALFVANATTGQIGVYDATGARHTDAITSSEFFSILQKKSDGSVKRTTLLKWADVTASRKSYVAPVKAVGSIGWSGTAGGLNLAAAPATGKLYEIAILETTEGNQPFPTWNFEYQAKPNDAAIDVVQGLAAMINDFNSLQYKSNDPIVRVKVKADATYSAYAVGAGGTLTLTNGSKTVTTAVGTINFTVGDYFSVDASATPTDSVGDIYKVVAQVDANTWTLNRAYQGATQTFTEAEAEGTRLLKAATFVQVGLQFNAINEQEHFRLVARQELAYADIVNLSSYTYGNGIPDQVLELELEGNTYDGNTAGNTQYGNEAYGDPDRFAKDNGTSETYDMFHFIGSQQATLVGAVSQGKIVENIILAAPKSSGGITAALNTLFGL